MSAQTKAEREQSIKGRLSWEQKTKIRELLEQVIWAGREIIRIAKLEKQSRRTTLHAAMRVMVFWADVGLKEIVP